MAVVALSFAIVGTAVAGPGAILNKISKSKVKKISKRQANKAIDAREADLNVNSALTAEVGGPAAYAQIQQGGGIDDGEPSRAITDADVTSPETVKRRPMKAGSSPALAR